MDSFEPFRVFVTDEEAASVVFTGMDEGDDDDDEIGKALVEMMSWTSGEGSDEHALNKRCRVERANTDDSGSGAHDLCLALGPTRDDIRGVVAREMTACGLDYRLVLREDVSSTAVKEGPLL